jgi:hypothetical protein
MKTLIRYGGPMLACAILMATGCTRTAPATSNVAPDIATPQRSVLDVDESIPEPLTEDQAKAQLPAQISVADAERLLVKVDESQIIKDKPYSVLRGRGGGRGRGRGGHGHHGHGHRHHGFGHGGGGFGWGWGGLGWGGYGWPGYGFYGLGNYYYPYALSGNYYTPYSYSPYLYSGLGSPFASYGSPFAPRSYYPYL